MVEGPSEQGVEATDRRTGLSAPEVASPAVMLSAPPDPEPKLHFEDEAAMLEFPQNTADWDKAVGMPTAFAGVAWLAEYALLAVGHLQLAVLLGRPAADAVVGAVRERGTLDRQVVTALEVLRRIFDTLKEAGLRPEDFFERSAEALVGVTPRTYLAKKPLVHSESRLAVRDALREFAAELPTREGAAGPSTGDRPHADHDKGCPTPASDAERCVDEDGVGPEPRPVRGDVLAIEKTPLAEAETPDVPANPDGTRQQSAGATVEQPLAVAGAGLRPSPVVAAAEVDQRLTQVQAEADRRLAALRGAGEEQLAKLRAEADQHLAEALGEYEAQLSRLRHEHQQRLAEERQASDAQVAAARAETERQLDALEQVLLSRMDKALLRQEQHLRRQAAERIARLKEEHREAQQLTRERAERAAATALASAEERAAWAQQRANEADQRLRQYREEGETRIAALEERLRQTEATLAERDHAVRVVHQQAAAQMEAAEQRAGQRIAQVEHDAWARISELQAQLAAEREAAVGRTPLRDRWRRS
ncbi:hypothetical protein [Streptomyces himalayensis]|uniref:Uncharacterized protein n=1 Tax=Streptomyces himalayensis subsp. himalayensis TaxID=2756131 RepID=A0A7W0DLE8_9ACTN|nr:hypothetical protein [Streptomyces himalayensis]MBA2946494.1 hypothetical protein [Streptomyces himalayensis subsp. himalayensis]